MTERLPIVIDCDPGVDDALAIAMAAGSVELEIVGLTTVFGNAPVDLTTHNARGLAKLVGLSVPLSRGAARPLAAPFHGGVPQVHGKNGMGGSTFLDECGTVDLMDDPAAMQLIKLSHKYSGQLIIVALGPLTNLALAAHLDPSFPSRVSKVVVMGGNAFCPGNATPTAEANMWNDPEAADFVFGLSWAVTMIGLDVTHNVNLTGSQLDNLAKKDTPGGQIAHNALPIYRAFFEETNGTDGIFCHDPTVIAYLLRPDLFVGENYPLRVETVGMSRGKTWPALGDTDDAAPAAWEGRPEVSICTGGDGPAIAQLVIDRLSSE